MKLIIFVLCVWSAWLTAANSPVVMGKARFTVLTDEVVRLEYDENRSFVDDTSLFATRRESAATGVEISQAPTELVIETSQMKLVYRPDGKPFHAKNLTASIKGTSQEWVPGKTDPLNLGGTITSLDGIEGPVNLGMGLLSRSGWFLLDDSGQPVLTKDWVKTRESQELDWYLFAYGTDYKRAFRALTQISGEIPLPRKVVLGSWYSRYWPYSSQDYRQIANEYDQYQFPLDIMVLDMDWHKNGWTGWSWNRKLLPDAEALLAWFEERGLQTTLNVHPSDGVGPHEDMYAAFMTEMGVNPATKTTIPYDAANKKYLDTLFKHTHTPHEESGVDFWWLDWQQTPFTPSIPKLKNIAWLNQYYSRHSSTKGLRPQSFSRWGGWGDHRNPIHFSGDARTTWPMLEFEVAFNATSANVGLFFWSHDIGGHWGPRNDETMTRWVQFGATTAALRVHSTRSADLDRRPWTSVPEARDAMRKAFHLRSELFPYLYSSVYQSHRDSIPLNRSLYIEYPKERAAYQNPQEYLWGDALLVAPITSPGVGPRKVATQTVWFPKGEWYDWFTGEKFVGPKQVLVSADLDSFPLYVKGGSAIPMQRYQARMTSAPLDTLRLRVFPAKNNQTSNFTLYEDDGASQGYLSKESATTKITTERKRNWTKVFIAPTFGSFKGQLPSRVYQIDFPATKRARVVYVNGQRHHWQYNSETHTNSILLRSQAIRRGVTILISVDEIDPMVVRQQALARRVHQLLGENWDPAQSFEKFVADYLRQHGQTPQGIALLGLGGIGMAVRTDGVYMYPATQKSIEVYTGGEWLSANKTKFNIVEDTFGTKKTLVESECNSSSGVCRFPLPLSSPFGSSQVASLKLSLNEAPLELEKIIQPTNDLLSRWQTVGPFPYDSKKPLDKQNYDPELQPVDLNAKFPVGTGTVSWQKAPALADGILDLGILYKSNNSIGYAVTFIESTEDQSARLRINSDDGVEVWLDQKKIHSNDILRPITTPPDLVDINLSRGKHTLLVKISNLSGGWQSRIGLETKKPIMESELP
jgi:hypothetical protein